MSIRELRTNDYKAIHGLITNEMQHDEVLFDDLSCRLDIMLNDTDYLLFVSENDGCVTGFICALKSIGCIDGLCIDILCLVVLKTYQGKGIGEALLGYVENLGRGEGIENYSTTSGLHRTDAHRFYEKHGYEKGGYAFYKGLVIIENKTENN